MDSLKDKVVIVTGASSGIGREIAVYFAKYGSKLAITARNEKALDETVELCVGQTKENILKVVADVCDTEQRKRIVEKTIEKFGRLDVLVNNAGLYVQNLFKDITEDDYERTMNTNLKSVVFLTQLCVPHLIETKGCIVNISSVCSTRCYEAQMTYCISKAAIDQFTRCLAIELAPNKVRVNSVNPGGVITNILKANNACNNQEEEKKLWEMEGKLHPLGRNAELSEIASVVGFLASDQALFITGENLFVDGGRQLV